MYRIVLWIEGEEGIRDFDLKREAVDILIAIQALFKERGFVFVDYDPVQHFYLYQSKEGYLARIGMFISKETRSPNQPFLRVKKKEDNANDES